MSGTELASNTVIPQVDKIVSKYHYNNVLGVSNRDEVIKRISADSIANNVIWNQQNIASNVFLDRQMEFDFEAEYVFPFGAGIDVTNVANQGFIGAPGPAIVTGPGNAGRRNALTLAALIDRICLSFLPVFSTATNASISVNSQSNSFTPSRYLRAMMRFNGNDKWECARLNRSPMFKDYSTYDNLVDGGLIDQPDFDPFEIEKLDYPKRGQILPTQLYYRIPDAVGAPNVADAVVVRYAWVEYCPLSPLTNLEVGGFYNIDTFSMSITPGNQLNYLSITNDFWNNVITQAPFGVVAYTGGFTTEQAQRMRLYTVTSKFPRSDNVPNFIPGERMTLTTLNIGNVAPGAEFTGQSNSFSLNKVPSRIFIFANYSNELYNSRQADVYGLFTKLSIVYNNKSDYFNQWNQQDIYESFVWGKGYKVPYNIYANYCGGPLCLEPQDYYGSLGVAGSPIVSNYQIGYTIKNPTNAAINFELKIVQVYDQLITYTNNSFVAEDIIVNTESVLGRAADEQETVPTELLTPVVTSLGAGSIKDQLVNAASNVVGGVGSLAKYYGQNKAWIDPLIKSGVATAAELFTSLVGGGLSPDLAYLKLVNAGYPQSDLKKIQQSMYQAGCISCSGGTVNFSAKDDYIVSAARFPAAGMKKKSKAKRGGVIIEEEEEFEEQHKPIRRVSIRDRY